MNRDDLAREARLRARARRQGYRLTRQRRRADPWDPWTGSGLVARFWILRTDGTKVGGPRGLSLTEAEDYLTIAQPTGGTAMTDTMSLDEGEARPNIYAAVINPACICTWERTSDAAGWDMVRLVRHCVVHQRVRREDQQ